MNDRGLDAEGFRQSHCDRKAMAHRCIGKITLAPGMMQLDCTACGEDTQFLEDSIDFVETARSICSSLGVDYSSLSTEARKAFFRELKYLLARFGRWDV